MKTLVGIVFCFTLLFAQDDNTLFIDALDFKADSKGVFTFTGNVKIKMAKDMLNAQKVDVYFESNNKTNNKIPTMYEATGNVDFEVISQDKYYVGKGDKIIYNPKNEEYTVIGNGFLHEKNSDRKVYGDVIYINKLIGQSSIKGNENKPVQFIIDINKSDKN